MKDDDWTGGLEFEVYRSIRSVFVIRISVENESGAIMQARTDCIGSHSILTLFCQSAGLLVNITRKA